MKFITSIDLSTFSKSGRFAYLTRMKLGVLCLILGISLTIKLVITKVINTGHSSIGQGMSTFQTLFTIFIAIVCLVIFILFSSLLFRAYYSKRKTVKMMNGILNSSNSKSFVYINEQDFSDIKMPYQLLSLNKEFKQPNELYELIVDSSDYYKLELIHDHVAYRSNSVITNECSSSKIEDIENFYGCNNRQLYNILNEHHKSMELSYMGAKKLARKLIKAQNTLQHHYSIKNTDTVSKGFHQIQKQSKNHDLKFYEDLKTLINEEGIK